tara:strand:- start:664 stop:1068 length:405 start_codon:yes stop_codon:yes gene_type:complete
MAAAWAVVRYLGAEGYRRLVRATLEAADRIRTGIRAIDGLEVPGDPRHHLLSITATSVSGNDQPVLDMYAIDDALAARGWHHDRQGPPDGLHLTVSNGNVPVVEQWLDDLAEVVGEVRSGGVTSSGSGAYATLE